MNQRQFLFTLEKHLRRLPKVEIEEIIGDYKEYFLIGIEEGKTENDIAAALGSPKQLANELNAVYAINQFEERKSIKNIFLALFSIMGLSVMNCIMIIVGFFILLILLPFMLAYIIAVPVMLFSPFVLLVLGFINGFSTIGISEVLEAIKGVIIGAILAFLGYFIAKTTFRLFVKYLKWNISIVKEKEV